MSTQINNASVTSITPTFDSLHWIYASSKSPNGYVIHTKRLQNKEAVWTCPSLDQAQMWISHQLLMKQRQTLIDSGMSKAEAVASLPKPTLDNATQTSYTVETSKTETTMDINNLSIQELASLQLRIATRMSFLLAQEEAQQSYNNAPAQSAEPIAETVDASAAIVEETVPSSAEVVEPAPEVTTEPAPRVRRKVGAKSKANVEAVAAKIEETLCRMTRDEAKQYIKELKLPIKSNMSCENLNDAINAYNAGGFCAVPAQYLTKAGAAKQAKEMPKAQEVAVKLAKKQVKSNKSR